MDKIFNMESPIWVFLTKVANIMILNILWLLCCIPVVTIGASTAAMYSVAIQLSRNTGDDIAKPFFRALKKDFVKATALFLVLVLVAAVVLASTYLGAVLLDSMGFIIYIPAFFFLLVAGYVFPLFAQFENTIWHTLKNAAIMSVFHILRSLIILALNILPFVVFWFLESFFWQTFVFWLLFSGALTAVLVMKVLNKVFDFFIQAQEPEEEPEASGE